MDINKITPNYLFLSEAIRLEGYLMKTNFQGAAVSNKDINILLRLESSYKELYPDRKTSKHLVIVLYLEDKSEVEKISTESGKELKFHVDKNNRLIFIQPLKDLNIKYKYYIRSNSKENELKIFLTEDGTINTQSKIHSTAYATLQIYNAELIKKLHYEFKIPIGIGSQKSYILDFPFEVNKLSKAQIVTIIDNLISCEGCVFYNRSKGDRVIKIKLASKKYLEKAQLIFNKLKIECQELRPTTDGLYILDIRKRNNFEKIFNEVKLTSQRKYLLLREILLSYSAKRFTHFEATLSYLRTLLNLGPASSEEIAKRLNRSRDTVYVALEKSYKKGYLNKVPRIFTGNGSKPAIYKINANGVDYINSHL
jgi:hypothetical protein